MRKIAFFSLLFVLVAGVGFLFGDQGDSQQTAQAHSGHEQGATETAKQATPEEAVNIGNKVCPVSGEKISDIIKSGMKPATYEYKGKIYTFCCAACIEDFKKEPEKYIKKIEEEEKLQASQDEGISK